ncbi:thioredoxin family protein [Stenotrophomonas maltophilia]|uniref:protein-disulfide reductase DsbD family protein n=1 Tax=Stenotrophomonas TaxID=40323 RepID=UPI000DA86D4A|nr:protein-disulfide reductase DsbD [Stenotrophomonas maltophilia]MCO7399411.1 thioredoxin family protein [Stenotrophomonas maltophilia]MCO7412223.1 thioredoxin family protein [Stenotrophomonas maltophilia]UXY48023.1 protein-disulfide reductase DsbD family protein [Stenotrophomonas maltophilia]HEL7629553.1 protein-disulfide reductase DsbD [Stenotrophomonas maltophilia]
MMNLFARAAALCALLSLALPAFALDEKDLLPVDQAFALTASAPERNQIQLQFKIAPGYYLYRHRTSVKADPAFNAGALQMPSGTKHHDDFFGEVETYRERLQVSLPGAPTDAAGTLSLEVRYQGCADAGVCYPPQKRVVQVTLPGGGGGAAAALPTARVTGVSAFNTPLAGAGSGGGLRLPGSSNSQALPLPSEQAFGFDAIASDGNTLLLRFSPAPGYYLYRDRTSLKLEGSAGVLADAPRWPAAQSHRDEHFGDVSVYFNQVEVPLPLRRTVTDAVDSTLVVTFQGCQTDGICYPPMTRRVKLSIPAGKISAHAGQPAPRSEMIRPLPAGSAAPREAANGTPLRLLPTVPNSEPARADVAGAQAGFAADARGDNALRTRPPATTPDPDRSFLWVLLLALAGGLVLNLMPCVLPILSLKVLGLAQSGESAERARSHAMWYTLGVLVAFAVIGALMVGLRMLGNAVGIGFQLQHPGVVAALAYIMFAVGLSLSGVFTLGGGLGNLGQSLARRSGPAGDFFTGALACVVGSACVGPFMGGAVAYAFVATPVQAMAVFLFLGLGLALPFLLIGFVPALARRLPKPGPWMETLKHVLAFPMYATALWLLWVLGKQRGVDGMALALGGLLLLALGLWLFERSRWRSQRAAGLLGVLLAIAALVPVWGVTQLKPPARAAQATSENVVEYSPQLLDRLRADNRVVFVNMTADWCVSCKANERAVLSRPEFRELLRRTNAVYMRGDYTNVDPQITAFLDEHKAVGVPLYVVYGPGAPPTVLPTLLTQAVVEEALLRTAR